MYIKNCSNHPPTVIKPIPKSISKQLSDLSSNKDIFEKSKRAYSDDLTRSGFKGKLHDNNDSKQQRHKTIWYNPPYSTNMNINIGKKTFLDMIKKHFPKNKQTTQEL